MAKRTNNTNRLALYRFMLSNSPKSLPAEAALFMSISRFEGAQLDRLQNNSVQNPWRALLGESPRIYAGEGALQRSGKSLAWITRFSAGHRESPVSYTHLTLPTKRIV